MRLLHNYTLVKDKEGGIGIMCVILNTFSLWIISSSKFHHDLSSKLFLLELIHSSGLKQEYIRGEKVSNYHVPLNGTHKFNICDQVSAFNL